MTSAAGQAYPNLTIISRYRSYAGALQQAIKWTNRRCGLRLRFIQRTSMFDLRSRSGRADSPAAPRRKPLILIPRELLTADTSMLTCTHPIGTLYVREHRRHYTSPAEMARGKLCCRKRAVCTGAAQLAPLSAPSDAGRTQGPHSASNRVG